MLYRKLLVAVIGSAMMAGAAMAQEGEQTPQDGAPPSAAEATAGGCVPAKAPGRLMITMPKAPALPACAEKNNCSKAVADLYNAGIVAHNKNMAVVNEATADYVDKLNDYARTAGRYAQCEIARLNTSLGLE